MTWSIYFYTLPIDIFNTTATMLTKQLHIASPASVDPHSPQCAAKSPRTSQTLTPLRCASVPMPTYTDSTRLTGRPTSLMLPTTYPLQAPRHPSKVPQSSHTSPSTPLPHLSSSVLTRSLLSCHLCWCILGGDPLLGWGTLPSISASAKLLLSSPGHCSSSTPGVATMEDRFTTVELQKKHRWLFRRCRDIHRWQDLCLHGKKMVSTSQA